MFFFLVAFRFVRFLHEQKFWDYEVMEPFTLFESNTTLFSLFFLYAALYMYFVLQKY